jgi:FkbM family methyltransferase
MIYKFINILIKKKFNIIIRLIKYLYLLKLKLAKNLFHFSVIRSIYGVSFFANYEDKTFKYYICGNYDNFFWNKLTNINYKFIFLDIGANQGLYTICAGRNSYNIATYAFEPVEKTYNFLQKNISLNNLSHKCLLFQKAISDNTGSAQIVVKKNHSGSASLMAHKNIDPNLTERSTVNTIDGNKLYTLIKPEYISLIVKIDVEGLEPIVLKQLISSKLIENIKEIFFEAHYELIDIQEIEEILKKVGFKRFKRIKTGGSHYDILATKD